MANNFTHGARSTNPQRFTARGGTGDEGKDFEELLIISKCLELAFDSSVVEFSISSDDKKFGDFDDLVVEVEYLNGKEEKLAFQLKHVEDEDKLLTPKILGGTGKKFAISKYYQSCGKIPDEFSLILFTNKKFEMENERLVMDCRIGTADILVDVLKINQENRYEFVINKADNISEVETKAYEKFLNRFQLMSNQENTKQLENRILTEFLKFHGTEDTLRRFRDFIRRWKKEKKNKLDKRTVTIKIVESLLSPFMKTISHDLYYTDFGVILGRAILSFNFTTFEDTNEVIHKIWINRLSDREINKCGFEQFLLTQRLDKIKDEKLRGYKYSLISWHLGQSPLIVEVTENLKPAIYEAVELLKKNGIQDRKLLLLGQKEEIQSSGCFRNLNCLKNENRAVYQEILKKVSCSLQGRLYKLQEIVDSEDFEKIINTDCLVKISNPNFNVGRIPEELPEFYVPRALPRILIDINFLKEEKTDDVILINCKGKKEDVKKHLKDVRIVDVQELLSHEDDSELTRKSLFEMFSDESKNIICLHPTECSSEEFSKIIKQFPKKNCHHFNYYEEYVDLEWINTVGDVKALLSYRTASEVFEKEDEFLQRSRRTIKVVCADPGMGKTTMLKHFYGSINKSCWLLHLTARQYSSKITQDMNVENFVFSLANDSLEAKFVETFYGRREIIFMWDGLDEILDNEEKHRIYGFIKNIQVLGFVQFITSRCNLQKELEEKFGTLATRIEELTGFEQNEYLHNRLSKKYNDEQLSDITAKVTENVQHLEAEKVLGVPLQLYLLTELFLQASNIDNVFKEPLTATALLEHFVNNKFKIHFRKTKTGDASIQKIVKKTIARSYKLLGTKICIESIADLKFFDQSEVSELIDFQDQNDPIGLVKKSGEMSLFVHQSYAEYFAALFLSENYRRIRNFQEVYFDARCTNLRFMLDLILARDCPAHTAILYRNLRILENHKESILGEDAAGRNALHIALSWSREHLALPHVESPASAIRIEDYLDKFKMVRRILKYMLEEKREIMPLCDKMFNMDYICYSNECLLELAIVTNEISVVQFICQNNGLLYGLENRSLPLVYAAFIGNQDICKFLIFNGANVNCTTKHKATALMYAATRGYLNVVEVLIDNNAEINVTENGGRSPLWFAAANNQLPVVQLLIENNVKVNLPTKSGNTPLMFAAENGYLDIAKILIDNKAEVNMTENEERSPIWFAAANNQLPVVQLLIENSAKVNLPKKNGNTPLMRAAQGGYLDIAKILIDNKAEVNMTENEERSPIWFAAANNQLPVVQLLIENSAKVNLPKKNGNTPLMRAAQDGYLDIAKILIDNEAEVNMTENGGRSPIWFAAANNQLPVVQLLIENNATVNFPTKNGNTPLMRAAQGGYLEIAKILIDNKAEVNMTENEERSSLWFAVANNQLPVVQLLIENRAKVNLPTKSCNTPLMRAAEGGYLDIAKILIDNKAEVNMTENEERSSLWFAVANNQLPVVQLLIANNAKVNLPTKNGDTPLMRAAQNGYLDIAKILIGNEAEVNTTENGGRSPLWFAAANNQLPVVQLLIENGAKVNLPNKSGNTPLMKAAQNGHLDIAKILIDNEAEVNMTDNEGRSPIWFAAANNQLPVVQLLIANNAKVNLPTKNGDTPLMSAAQNGYLDIAKILIDNEAEVNMTENEGRSPLWFAAANNQLPVVQLLIENSAKVDLPTKRGNTPLMRAAQDGYLDIAKILIDNEAEVNMTENEGRSPLWFAAANNQLPVVQLLIENSAKVDLPTKRGNTPLMSAAQDGYLDIAMILIGNEAEVNMTENEGRSPLWFAAANNQLPVVQLLIENGAKVNLPNKSGNTPLMIPAQKGYLDIAKILIDNEAEVNMTDSEGRTPLMAACNEGFFEVVNYLLEAKAKINYQNYDGDTALHISARNNNLPIMKLLIQKGADLQAKNRNGRTPVELPNLSPEVQDYFLSINVLRPRRSFLQRFIELFTDWWQ